MIGAELESRLLLTVTDITSGATFTTIQAAVNAATAGDTILADAGTYNETVTVNKPLTIEGAQHGVDARTRTAGAAAESVLTGTGGGFQINANNVIIDGFTIQGTTSATPAGAAITTSATTAGDQILNNILQNNTFGLYLNSSTGTGTAQTVVRQNLFQNNSNTVTTSGSAITSDAGAQNVLIDSNKFSADTNAEILFGATGTTTQSNVTISNNQLVNGSGIALSNLSNATITGNTITNGTASAIRLGGGVSGATITGNTILNGAGSGVDVTNLVNSTANANIKANFNRFFGNAVAGVNVANNAYTGTLDATENWWGSNTGPNMAGNDKALGSLNSSPFLVLGVTGSALTVGPGGTSTITADLTKDSAGATTSTQGHFPNGTPIAFTATGGTILPASAPTTNGVATARFTSTTTGTNSVTAKLDNQSQSVAITASPITISPTTLPGVTSGAAYNQTIIANGGAGGFTYAVTSGTLPTGLTLAANGILSGTTTATGPFPIVVTATDASNATATQAYTLTVNPGITFPTTTLAPGTVATVYNGQIAATGGTGTLTYTVSTGTLPAGLILGTNGAITGIPTTAGTSTFTVAATDQNQATATHAYTLTVNPQATFITISPTALPTSTLGTAVNQQLTATGGTGPYQFAVTAGSLPTGLTLSSAGLLSGTPTVTGSFPFTVTATDQNQATGTQAYTLQVSPQSVPVVFSPGTPPAGTVGKSYSFQVTATGGTGALLYAVTTGSLPAGLTLSNTGLLSGTPTATGSFPFTVTAADLSGNSATQNYTVQINAQTGAITISPASPPQATAGTAYNQQFTATGGTGTVQYAVTTGSLPAGLTLSNAGLLSGTPTTAGTYPFTITATDQNGATGTLPLSFVVAAAPPVAVSPTVVGVQRFGFHEQPTTYVITFSSALDPVRAQNVSNYRLVPMSGAGAGRPLAIASAVYNPTAHTVTLHPADRVYIFRQYQLTINGTAPTGVAGPDGSLLAGQGTGKPGTNYVTTFGQEILAGSNIQGQTFTIKPARRHQVSKLRHTLTVHRTSVRHATTVAAAAASVAQPALAPQAVDTVLGEVTVPKKGSTTVPGWVVKK